MRKVLIVSHGRLASGIKSSVEVLTGDASAITAIDAYLDDRDYTLEVRDFIAGCGPADEAIVFTDLLGGSVFQKVVTQDLAEKSVMHVTGTNLAVVLECLLTPEPLTPATVDQICHVASTQLKRVEVQDMGKGEESPLEDDFFA